MLPIIFLSMQLSYLGLNLSWIKRYLCQVSQNIKDALFNWIENVSTRFIIKRQGDRSQTYCISFGAMQSKRQHSNFFHYCSHPLDAPIVYKPKVLYYQIKAQTSEAEYLKASG